MPPAFLPDTAKHQRMKTSSPSALGLPGQNEVLGRLPPCGGFAGTTLNFVPNDLLYVLKLMESLFGEGCCHLLMCVKGLI